MARYIDADSLKDRVFARSEHVWDIWDTAGLLNVIEEVKAADVAPVVHAHWKDDFYTGELHLFIGICSNCLTPQAINDYCGNCGAKMDGEADNE